MAAPLLEIRNVKKYYPVKKVRNGEDISVKAVDQIDLTVNQGEIVGLVGESGCGKSTLGKTILKLHDITGGQILFHGEDITNYTEKQMRPLREKIQIIFQDPYASLDPRKTISQIISEPIIINKILTNKQDVEDRVHELMDTVGLAQRLVNTYPHELDGGRRQRIGIARALAMNPKFIVCDEPVSALDVSIQAQILNLLQDLQEKMELTFMFITHDLSVVNHFSDDIAVMYLGQLVEKAPAEELFAHPLHPYTKALFSAIPIPDPDDQSERIIIKGEITSPINLPDACHFAPRCQYCKENCHHGNPALVEVRPNHFVACSCVEEINAL